MKVLKFGGSSVANAENIQKVISIVESSTEGPACAVVLSAMQGTTDELIEAGRMAERGDNGYVARIDQIREKHLSAAAGLFSDPAPQTAITGYINSTASEIASLCDGVSLVRELSPRTLDRIVGYGELLSTKIFAGLLTASGAGCEWKDSRELIATDSNFGFAAVDFAV